MTQDEKQLLLKDLCGRLPYGVKCNVGEKNPYTLSRIEVDDINGHLLDFIEKKNELDMQVYLSEVKPYLYPLSSMTDEQKKELKSLMVQEIYGILYHTIESYDYLNKHNIDYRGLIPMELAYDATGKNIY